MSKLKSILILNYTGNRVNWGCCATSEGLLKIIGQISDAVVDTIPLLDHDIYDEILDVRKGAYLNEMMLQDQLSKKDKDELMAISEKRFGSDNIDKIRKSDIVIFQAEGTMTGQSFYAGVRLLMLPFIAKVIFNKPVLSLNQTVFSAEKAFSTVIKHVYSLFDVVALREAASYKYMLDLGVENSILIPDAAFLTQYEQVILPFKHNHRKFFAVTGSAKIEKLPIVQYANLIKEISRKFDLIPVFLLSTPADKKILNYFDANECDFLHFDHHTNYEVITKIIDECLFLIGGRYHMCLLSAVAKTPFVPLTSNTFKNEGLIALLSYPIGVMDFLDNNDEVLRNVVKILKNHEEYVKKMEVTYGEVMKKLEIGTALIQTVFTMDSINKQAIDEVLQKEKYRILQPQEYFLQISDNRWQYYYELNSHAIFQQDKKTFFQKVATHFKKIPILFPLIRQVKYLIKEYLYFARRK